MIQDSLISLFTDLIVPPMQADIIAKFATARHGRPHVGRIYGVSGVVGSRHTRGHVT